MNGPGMVQLVHDYAAMEQPATISAEGVKALSAEVKRLQAIEERANALSDLSGPTRFRVVDTDNFDGDYPDEKFVGPYLPEKAASMVANALNSSSGPNADRFYKVVPSPIDNPYKLQPGFEP